MTSSYRELGLLYDEACCGNREAMIFVIHWNLYCHGIDDIIDGEDSVKPQESVLAVFSEANVLYTLPFYREHWMKLQTVVQLVTNAYADSVAWEGDGSRDRRTMADVLRFAGNEMIFAVALICGGYANMRRISGRIREQSWKDHHNERGEIK